MKSYRIPSFIVPLVLVLSLVAAPCARAQSGSSKILDVNFRKLISRADLSYDKPASRSEEGMPVGNGRMGSLVWTSPSALKFQINRVDVFAENSYTTSFPRADTDYASGCAYLDINLVQSGDDVFAGAGFHQSLSVYEGLMTAQGKGVTAGVLAWPGRDVMAVEIDDQRAQPEAVNIDLRMLRYLMQEVTGKNYELASHHAVMVTTAEHSATSRLDIRGGRIVLTQEFREAAYYDSSAIAVAVIGRPSKARYLNESTVLLAAPGKADSLSSSRAPPTSMNTRTWPLRRSPSWMPPLPKASPACNLKRKTGGAISGPKASFTCTAPMDKPISSSRTTPTSSISWAPVRAANILRVSAACSGTPPATSAAGVRNTGGPTRRPITAT